MPPLANTFGKSKFNVDSLFSETARGVHGDGVECI